MPYIFLGGDIPYLVLVVVSTILGLGTQAYIKRTYARWSRVDANTSLTGAEVARNMLQANGAYNVGIQSIAGELTDNFDPRTNTLNLSSANRLGGSIASIAVACHEAGHAVQFAKGYVPMKIRSTLVPVVQFASGAWMYLFFAGIMFNLVGLMQLAIILFAASVLFHLITLPVEIDASRRAVAYIASSGSGLDELAKKGAKQVLIAAALTYVAAALVSILQLVYLLSRSSRD
ncbi:MAG: zinc metallopeptidase [Atopobium sp.]|uniref:zinc metallopeptidase n=1 Tax=Atopobium sp. TaxID=1872650 RepID=UPI002A747DFE|nr:zinc metallopeptidase [Atopobium sp.]MDY2788175.1 zinc metallopeptidase [Atopobium sp.]